MELSTSAKVGNNGGIKEMDILETLELRNHLGSRREFNILESYRMKIIAGSRIVTLGLRLAESIRALILVGNQFGMILVHATSSWDISNHWKVKGGRERMRKGGRGMLIRAANSTKNKRLTESTIK